MNEKMTKDWKLYQAGIDFNNAHKTIETAKLNTEMYEGNQWLGAQETKLAKPTLNILKRVGSYFCASLTSNPIKAFLNPLLFENFDRSTANQVESMQDLVGTIDIANATLDKVLERNKFQFKVRRCVENAIKTGDMALHMRFDTSIKPYVYAPKYKYKGDIVIDVINGVNVFVGNANIHDIQNQPYVIISGRDTIENLKNEMKSRNEIEKNRVVADNETSTFLRNDVEISTDEDSTDKCTYIIKYFKKKDKDGNVKVFMNKSTKDVMIYENIDTGLSMYPIAFGNWEIQEGNYHGRALVTGLIPNQVFINRMWAMVMYHLQLNAFPKAVYDASRIQSWTNEIGVSIPVRNNGDPNFNINNIAKYLEPAQMSPQVTSMLDSIVATTKDMLGISDATLGNVNPTNTSAIVAIQKSSAVPLKNQQANLYQFVEDAVLVLLDMLASKYGIRDVAVDMKKIGIDSTNVVTQYDFANLKDLPLSLDISIGEGNYYDEIAQQSTLDNLLNYNHISLRQYLERVPNSVVPKRIELLREVEAMEQQMQMMGQMPSDVPSGNGTNNGMVKAPETMMNMSQQEMNNLIKAMQSQSGEEQIQTMQAIR